MEDLLTGYMQATTHVTIKRTGNYFYASIYMDCKHISYSAYSSHSFMNALLSIMLSYKRGSIAE